MSGKVEFRQLRSDEMGQYRRFCHYAFGLDEEFEEWEKRALRRRMEPDTLVPFGYFVDGTLVSTCAYIPLRIQLRDRERVMAGITSVTTPPEYRRRGYVADMLRRLLAELASRDMHITGLWPFSREFYARYGWATCVETSRFEMTTEVLRRVVRGYRPQARFIRASMDDVPELEAVRRQMLEPFQLSVLRDREGWRTQTFSGWKKDPFVYLARDASGSVAGYLAYLVEEEKDWDRDLEVTDFAYRDFEAYRELLAFLANHDSQINRFHISTSASDPLFDWVPDGGIRRRHGIMVRISDPVHALTELDVPADASGSLVLEVRDAFLPGGGAKCRLEVEGGRIVITDTDAIPDVWMATGAFSQLYTGYRSLDELRRFGVARVDGQGARLLAALLPRGHTCLAEHF